jgi:hypothetical protein
MFSKLRAAITKATNRIAGRKEDAEQAEAHAHELTREIRELRKAFDNLSRQHAGTLKKVAEAEKAGSPELAQWRRKAEREAKELRSIVHKLHHKRDRRGEWRERRRVQLKRYRWWVARRTVLRRKLRKAKKRWEETHGAPAFETWMLNGCPANITPGLKPIIAFLVVVGGQYITATTNGTHTSTSMHYPWNNSDNLGHAADSGQSTVSSMEDATEKEREHFGESAFAELFSPCDWWIKYGVVYPGHFVGHGDHTHSGVS